MFTVYARARGDFRVVNGAHTVGSYNTFARREYLDASDAFKREIEPDVKAAIALIEPSVLAIPASAQHHVVRASAVVGTYRGIKVSRNAGGYSWPNAGYFGTKADCERSIDDAFATGELGSAADAKAGIL